MKNQWIRGAAPALLLVAAVALAACEDAGDPTAPPDSTITVSGTPQTVLVADAASCPDNLAPGQICGSQGSCSTRITATILSKNGTLLPDQRVAFSTTAGIRMIPPADTFLQSDDLGQASSCLITSTAATVTARTGNITGTTQIQTAPGNLRTLVLTVNSDLGLPTDLDACNEDFQLSTVVEDIQGTPVPNFRVIFDEEAGSTLTGTFSPGGAQGNVLSDANGVASVTWVPGSTCSNPGVCVPGTNGGESCTLGFFVSDPVGGFRSVTVPINDNVN